MKRPAVVALAGAVVMGCGPSEPPPPPTIEVTAIGTEPFWSVEVATNTITLRQLDGPVLVFPSVPATSRNQVRAWQTRRSANEPLFELVVLPGECSDGMSDRRYPWQARVRYDGLRLAGCAMPGAARARRSL